MSKPKYEFVYSYAEKKFLRGIKYGVGALAAGCYFSGLAMGLALLKQPIWSAGALLIAGLVLIAFYFTISKTASWFAGIAGERKIEAILQTLWWKGYRPISSLRLTDRGNVDHVIVGPSGVWTIETKHWRGKISLVNKQILQNGKSYGKNPLQQAFAQASAVQQFLTEKGYSLEVRPILCFSADMVQVRFGEAPIQGVQVIGYQWLTKIIDNSSATNHLNQKEIESIFKDLSSVSEYES